jgi:excisionase family DNA binding protein
MSDVVSANEAAHRFGLSEKTVRRWIAAGKLTADKHGRAYRVSLSEIAALVRPDAAQDRGPSADTVQTADIHSAPSTADSRPNTSAMSGIAELVALVDRLQTDNRELATTAAVWQERARVLGEQLALKAPQAPQNGALDGSAAAQAQDPSPEPFRMLWRSWGRWWPAALAVVWVPLRGAGAILAVR